MLVKIKENLLNDERDKKTGGLYTNITTEFTGKKMDVGEYYKAGYGGLCL